MIRCERKWRLADRNFSSKRQETEERILKVTKKSGNRERCRKLSFCLYFLSLSTVLSSRKESLTGVTKELPQPFFRRKRHQLPEPFGHLQKLINGLENKGLENMGDRNYLLSIIWSQATIEKRMKKTSHQRAFVREWKGRAVTTGLAKILSAALHVPTLLLRTRIFGLGKLSQGLEDE